jgi:hypothetical protein
VKIVKKLTQKKGFVLVQALVFGGIGMIVVSALIAWASLNIKASRTAIYRERAIQIAEGGVDYYRWHLAHASQDYKDGTNAAGPYVHNFYDKDGILIGTFSLVITPPSTGSTIVTIESTGKVVEDATVSRKIRTKLAIPSLAKYAFVSNSDMRFGQGTEVFGPIHSNGGIRFDGVAHNIVTSAKTNYDDPDHSGANEFGVHTHVNAPPSSGVNDTFRAAEAPPTSPVPNRSDVFVAGRQFPVPSVDFTGLTTNLAQIKTAAQASGKYFAASGAQGYDIRLNNNNTFTVYVVNSLINPPSGCTNTANQTGWGSWSINNETLLAGTNTFPIPANGLIFVEDNVWVRGQINNSRVTIASGRFPDNPATRTSITVNNNLTYTNYGGQDVIALIAQNDVNAGLRSDNDLRIDAALVAQNGRIGRYYYNTSCVSGGTSWYTRNSITLYGMLATYNRYGFAYTDGTGYDTRTINYDANLLYGPPPSFPLTSDQYSTISWEEF